MSFMSGENGVAGWNSLGSGRRSVRIGVKRLTEAVKRLHFGSSEERFKRSFKVFEPILSFTVRDRKTVST
jgi:hypothetical protein